AIAPLFVSLNSARDQVVVQLADAPSAVIDIASISVQLDGANVNISATKNGTTTTVTYKKTDGFLAPASAHTLVINFKDTNGKVYSFTENFIVRPYVIAQGLKGNYYEFILQPGISWGDANAAAQRSALGCHYGHLATIASADEDAFVELVRENFVQQVG